MKVVGVIPARFNSSRLPGKPLIDICGQPMIKRVYDRAKLVESFAEVIVATDDDRIKKKCEEYNIPVLLTSKDHATHVNRIHEVSNIISADYYVVICGDEPLIDPQNIIKVFPDNLIKDDYYVCGLCRFLTNPTEVIDPGNIKVVTNEKDECILLSRAVIPFPYKTVMFKYKKVVGVECYNKKALDLFVSLPKGSLEEIEDVTLQRFLENKIHVKYRLTKSESLSVDTYKDLEKVREMIREMQSESNGGVLE